MGIDVVLVYLVVGTVETITERTRKTFFIATILSMTTVTVLQTMHCNLLHIWFSKFQCNVFLPPCRTTARNSGGLLASYVAGETTHNSHAHQPHGKQQDQVSTVLARVWEEAVWTIHSGHYRSADTG